jgi:glutamate racemase
LSKTRVIGVLGTEATVRQPYVDRLSAEFASDCRVVRHGSAELVEIAEAKLRGVPPDPAALRHILEAMYARDGGGEIDTVVLACTHFPLIEAELHAALGDEVRFVHGAEGIARRIASLTQGQQFTRTIPDFALFTGDPDQFASLLPALSVYGLDKAEQF